MVATAAEVLGCGEPSNPDMLNAVVAAASCEQAGGKDVAHARRRIVRAIGELRTPAAFCALWSSAIRPDDYPIRRVAIKALVEGGAPALEVITPSIREAIEAAEYQSRTQGVPAADDRGKHGARSSATKSPPPR